MKKAYTWILIGIIFVYLNLPLTTFTSLLSVFGYLMIFLGIFRLNKQKPNQYLELSKYLCLGLLCFEILKQGFYNLVGNDSTYAFLLVLALLIIQFLIFYLVIKSATDDVESLDLQTYQQEYLIVAMSVITLYVVSCFFPSTLFLLMGLQIIEFGFLCYIFYYLRAHMK